MAEAIDVAVVRKLTGMVWAGDREALEAFREEKRVFDVDPHCRVLDELVDRNGLDAVIEEDQELLNGRTVWIGSARWRKRWKV